MLDEPTNDLDLETLDLLQEVIADYDGTVLIVSHDRDFLDRTVTLTLGLDGSGKVDIVAGGYADWEARRRPKAEAKKAAAKPAPPRRSAPKARQAQLQGPARLRPAAHSGSRRSKPPSPATRKRSHDPALYARDPAKFAALTEAIEAARAEKDAAEMRWLELAEQVEALG